MDAHINNNMPPPYQSIRGHKKTYNYWMIVEIYLNVVGLNLAAEDHDCCGPMPPTLRDPS